MSKAARTREFIIEKTAPIFNIKGYAGTSLNDITDATGLTKGSIYGNFTNKDDVALAAFDYNLQCVEEIISQEIRKQKTFQDKLLVYANVYENFLKYPFPIGGCPILNTAIEADDTHPALKEKAANAINGWKNKLISLIQKGIDAKEFRPETNAEQTALTMIAMIEGGIMITKLTGKLNYRKAVMKSVEKIIKDLV
ncbi:TetR/AcrR family transcriptional regulator [Emticicia sp. BO119]|uniref:TetR/AcrR family transcriptional regulator n=1 Tax=Emticicia sp. BO119 TaxID=2757768 RepID=UPI0015F08741|nr:TetR/AcrR family transcriptional regulator [Emticicia sp. BO119]MBA4852626.1 TetR/AcrR family transcriptional regulator [Emticicia sp. BO119]